MPWLLLKQRLYFKLLIQMSTQSITKSKVAVDVNSSFEKNGKSHIFSKESYEGKSILGPNGKYYVLYEACENDKKILNILKQETRKITYLRYGPVQSRFEFELKKWTKCFCYIKGGFIEFNCFTDKLESFVSDQFAEIHVKYKLYANNSSIGTYNLNVIFKC